MQDTEDASQQSFGPVYADQHRFEFKQITYGTGEEYQIGTEATLG